MAQLIGGFCASHAPGQLVRRAEAGPAGERFLRSLEEVAARLRVLAPDVVIVCSGEHFTNFPPNAVPQLAIGVGDEHTGPIEPWMKIPRCRIPGAAAVARRLAGALLQAGFDPTTSADLLLDHGVTCGYLAIDPAMTLPVIPFIQNTLVSPMMPLDRCHALGRALGRAVTELADDLRVAVVGTGGLSHWIGTSRDGEIDEEFDRWFLARFAAGDLQAILTIADAELDHAGTGAHEIRSWLVAAGALEGFQPTVVGYEPIRAWITGMGVVDLTSPRRS